MAKKKVSKQVEAPKEVSQQDNSLKPMEDPSEKLASLKSLNALLVKETVERRQQVETLLHSNQTLESEISLSEKQKQMLAAEKNIFEDQTIEAELEHNISLVFVSSQLNQQAEKLKNQIRRGNEEQRVNADLLKAKMEEKTRDEEKKREEVEMKMIQRQREIDRVSIDFRSYREGVQKDFDLKQKESAGLKSMVADLEKNNAEVREKIRLMRMERDGVLKEKADIERRFEDLKREMRDVVRERDETDKARIERDCKIELLKKSVDSLTADLGRERDAANRVLREKDAIQYDLDIKIKETGGLRSKLLELERSDLEIQQELWKLQMEHEGLLEEKEEKERTLGLLIKDKASAKKSLTESTQLINDLKREIKEIVTDKQEIEQESTKQAAKISELQNEVNELSATISTLQKREEGLRSKVSELGKRNIEATEKQEKLLMEFNVLVEEKGEKERSFEKLMEEKTSMMTSLEESLQQFEDQSRKMQEFFREKAEIEQVAIKHEIEIMKLDEEASELRAAISTLQESCKDHTETKKRLESEVSHYRDAIERLSLERDGVQKDLNQEKEKGSSLRSKALEMEKIVKETQEELGQLRIEHDDLVEEKTEMENQFKLLVKDKALAEKTLVEAQQGLEDLQAKIKSSEMFSVQALSMLKNTAAMVSRFDDEKKDGREEMGSDAEKIVEEVQPYGPELETIKRAFRNRNAKVKDMTRKLEFLQNSLVEAQNKRNLWTWLSSATIFAAASLAYVAKGR